MLSRILLLLCFLAFVTKTTIGQRDGYRQRGRQQELNRQNPQQDPRNQYNPQQDPRHQQNPRNQQNPQQDPRNQQKPQQPTNNQQKTQQQGQPTESRENALMKINENLIKNLKDWHNNLRMKPNASNMVQMEWNEELAENARLYARECKSDQSERTISTESFEEVGENVFISSNMSDAFYIFKEGLKVWNNQLNNYSTSKNMCAEGADCSAILQVLWSKTQYFGCSHMMCYQATTPFQSFICQYAPKAHPDQGRPYSIVGGPCSACPDGKTCISLKPCGSSADTINLSIVAFSLVVVNVFRLVMS